MIKNESEQIEIEIEEMKKMQVARDDCLVLMNSASFKKVIEEGYFKEEAARLCMAKSSGLSDAQQKNIDGMILGIGGLYNYLETLLQRGVQVDNALIESERARAEIDDEEANKNG
jgi:hypothetical protein